MPTFIWTLTLAAMAFLPFTVAWNRDCPASCVMTVTTTVTTIPSCSVLSSATASSTMGASVANSTSSSTHEHHRHHNHHTTSPVAVATTSGVVVSTSAPSLDCQHDNCLRHFIRHPEVNGFCANYTTERNTARTGLPDLASPCQNDPTRISSACSCVETGVSTFTPLPPPMDCQRDNCLRHFFRHPEVSGFCATYTTELNTATTGLPDLGSYCHFDPTRISSACSCIATSTSSPPSSTGPQTTATNDGILMLPSSSNLTATSSAIESVTCAAVTGTIIMTETFVSTFTQDDVSTSEAMTSAAAMSYFTTTTMTETTTASSSRAVGHRHQHGHLHGRWFA